jgi:hypothetical protein
VFRRFPRELLAFSIFVATVALAVGCAQEGRIIEVPLPVSAIAFDQVSVVTDTFTTAHFKIDAQAANPCEAQNGFLELRLFTGAPDIRDIRPVSRYNTDSPCTALPIAPSDTVLRLQVVNFRVRTAIDLPGPVDSVTNTPFTFQVETLQGPPIRVVVDSTWHTAANMVRFEVRVEARTTGTLVAGATVAIDDMTTGSPVPLGSGATDAFGFFALDVPHVGALEAAALPYRVTVTNGTDQTVFTVRSAPARVQCRERVVIRI